MKIPICPLCDEPDCLDNCAFKTSTWWILLAKYGITRKDAAIVITAVLMFVLVVSVAIPQVKANTFGENSMIVLMFMLVAISTAISLVLANIFGVVQPRKEYSK